MKKTVQYLLLFLLITPFYAQTIPSYYNGLDLSQTGNDLFLELADRIEATHVGITYSGVWDACKEADEDPDIPTNILMIYGYNDTDGIPNTDRTRNKALQDTGGGIGVWNREHVFAQSLAIPAFGTDEPGPGTDAHNLRPADRDRNSERSNRKFTEGSGNSGIVSTNGGWYPGDEWKGDIARIVMYMYTRYHGNGTQVSQTSCLPINIGFGTALTVDSNMVDLFLKWNVEDPVSEFEANRNEVLAGIQMNRNPFIDNPYLATLIWGGLIAEDKWNMAGSSDTEAPTIPTNLTTTNITYDTFEISWNPSTDDIGVYDYLIYVNGNYKQSTNSTSTTISNLIPNTNYNITVKARDAASNYSEFSLPLNVTTLVGPTILFEENFEDCANIKFFSYNEASSKNWICETQYGEVNSGSIGINGYQEEVLSKDWLITKNPINFDIETGEKLSFYTDAAYGSSTLELLYSEDYDGSSNPINFIWTSVPNITIPIKSNTSGTEEIFTFSKIEISSITGSVYFAFKYYSNGVPTRWTVDSFEISADNNPDIDGDGVLNEDDLCSNTPIGETVDTNGCSYGQLDNDNDGVQNSDDTCPDTPSGEAVNINGCSESQLDDDLDGVMNNVDTCSDTPSGETVDANGCSYGQLDDDGDGVHNSDDTCADTPSGEEVNASGCSESQIDDDGDGVMNNVDSCSNTPLGQTVDTNGCAESQKDEDNDGIMNDKDQCLGTIPGSPINDIGCFSLPSTNFKIETTNETCLNKNNGKIEITAVETFNYKTTINGTLYNFTKTLTIESLPPNNYDFCILVEGQTFQQCYNVIIEAGIKVVGKASVNSNKVDIDILQGTAPFNVLVNGEVIFESTTSNFSVDAIHGDLIEVKTNVYCEGIFSKEIDLFENITAYPNPTKGIFEIGLPMLKKEVTIELYNIQSQLISSKTYALNYGKVQLNIEELPTGMYLAKVILDIPLTIKIIKQ